MRLTAIEVDALRDALANDWRLDLTAPDDDEGYARFEQRAKALEHLERLGLVGLRTQHNDARAQRAYFRVVAILTAEGRREAKCLALEQARE
jgi:hypothetical protein